MSSVSSTAPVSGIDLQAIIHALDLQSRSPAYTSNAEVSDSPTAISPAGQLQSSAAAFMDTAAKLSANSTWTATKAASNQPQAVTASSTSSTPQGQYNVTVDAVSTGQTISSANFSSPDAIIGLGTVSIELGAWSGSPTAFTANSSWPKVDIHVGPHDNSLQQLRDKINAAGLGVFAMVISDATGSRLVLRTTGTGAAQGFKVSTDSDPSEPAHSPQPNPDISALNFDPASMAVNAGMQLDQSAQDAQYRLNGKAQTSPSNGVDTLTPGLSLQISNLTSNARISVTRDKDVAHRAVVEFVDAYNAMRDAALVKADMPADVVSALQSIQQQVQSAVSGPSTRSLAAYGLRMDSQGQLNLDAARLARALSTKPEQVAATFSSLASGLKVDMLAVSPSQGTESTSSVLTTRQNDTVTSAAYRQRLLDQYRALTSDKPVAKTITSTVEHTAPDSMRLIASIEA